MRPALQEIPHGMNSEETGPIRNNWRRYCLGKTKRRNSNLPPAISYLRLTTSYLLLTTYHLLLTTYQIMINTLIHRSIINVLIMIW